MDEMNIFETAPSFPVIPLRGLVMFPDMVLHFDVERCRAESGYERRSKDLFGVPKGRSGR